MSIACYGFGMQRVAFYLIASALLLGCPPAETKKEAPKATGAACTKFGATCEVSPGKLGSCVAKDDCATGECFVCQSQH